MGILKLLKIAALKANHKTIVKYVSTIFTKCDIEWKNYSKLLRTLTVAQLNDHGTIAAMNSILCKALILVMERTIR